MEKNKLKALLLDLDPEEEASILLDTVDELTHKVDGLSEKVSEFEIVVGPKGEDGRDGKDGVDGVDGRDGKDGKNGKDGKDGKDGKNGEDGTDGKSVTLKEVIDKVRPEILMRIPQGGGAPNRQMFIGGVDPLTRYTDMNLKAGANVTLTYVNNDTTKKVDVTVAATGGSGGTVRSINSVSTNTAAAAAAGTDYVYLCSGTMTLTLPTAVGNTNLYTVKNVGSGTITIATTASQTIDAALTIVLPVQYTAVDLISDTANWNVT